MSIRAHVYVCLATLCLALPRPATGEDAPKEAEPPPWRSVQAEDPDGQDLRRRVTRAFRRLFGQSLRNVEVDPQGLRLERRGERFRVGIESLRVRFEEMKGWSGNIQGEFTDEDLRVEYGPLGVGQVEFLEPPRFEGELTADAASLVEYLEARDFERASIRFPEDAEHAVLEGRLQIGLLFFDMHPKVEVEGYFARDGRRFVFHPERTHVGDVPGFVRARIRDRLQDEARVAFGLEGALAQLRDDGVRFGTVHLTHEREGRAVRSGALPQVGEAPETGEDD